MIDIHVKSIEAQLVEEVSSGTYCYLLSISYKFNSTSHSVEIDMTIDEELDLDKRDTRTRITNEIFLPYLHESGLMHLHLSDCGTCN